MSAALAYSYKSSCSPLRVVYKAKSQTHDPCNRLLDYNMDRKPLRVENRGHGIAAFVYNDAGQRVVSMFTEQIYKSYIKFYATLFPTEFAKIPIQEKPG